jgi:hypothetical protein
VESEFSSVTTAREVMKVYDDVMAEAGSPDAGSA